MIFANNQSDAFRTAAHRVQTSHQYVAEEASAAGIYTLTFATRCTKRVIEDGFDNNQELEMALWAKGKLEQASMVNNILPEVV